MELIVNEIKHPNNRAKEQYNQLVGIDREKEKLVYSLTNLLDDSKINEWLAQHHGKKLPILNHIMSGTPLIILEGDVGCGKTALAQSVATQIGGQLKKKILVFETPSNIRGGGMVGGISDRITAAFDQVKRNLKGEELGILIIDEADDLATGREQNQAHHEDRAGVNVLIKELDSIKREQKKLAVIMITNRVGVIDPAIRRRCSLRLNFERPKGENLRKLIEYIFTDVESKDTDIDILVKELSKRDNLYSFSDLIHRVSKEAISQAIESNKPFSFQTFKKSLETIEPSPVIDQNS